MSTSPGQSPFKMRIYNDVLADEGYRYFDRKADVDMLTCLLGLFDSLDWIPPDDLEKRKLLEAHDFQVHRRMAREFLEFTSKGARGERKPWLKIYLHVDKGERVIRICGVFTLKNVRRKTEDLLKRIARRVAIIEVELADRRARRGSP